MNIFLFLILLAEVLLLFFLEKKMWKTIYTPLNFLMLPYLFVLGFTLIVAGRWGIEDFYYPSLIPWIVGLPLFAVPSLICFLLEKKGGKWTKVREIESGHVSGKRAYIIKMILSVLVVVPLAIRLGVMLAQGKGLFGSESFGVLFAGHGWSGHLLLLGVALVMLLMTEDKTRWTSWLTTGFIIFFLFVYQIKSWIILPLFAVVFAFLIRGKVKISSLLWVGLVSTAVFFVSYLLFYLWGGNTLFPQVTTLGGQIKSISNLFVHYVISGTMGLSVDMQQGILESPDLRVIFMPFFNAWNVLCGRETVSLINPEFLSTGINLTNVRGFFGTLFVFTTPISFALCSLLFSAVSYFVFWLFRYRKSVCSLLLFVWTAVILFIGWFEFLPQLSTIYEIPFWIIVLWNICRL